MFFVAAPIGPFDRDEAMPFIKPLRWAVDLECPQRQPRWAALLRHFDKTVADAAASPERIEIELAPVLVKSNETGCVYRVGCGWSAGWLIQALSGSLGGRGRRVKRSGCSA